MVLREGRVDDVRGTLKICSGTSVRARKPQIKQASTFCSSCQKRAFLSRKT
jgi:hypothetical protein